MAGVHKYKDGVVGKNWKGLQGLIKSRGIETIEGEGRLVGPKTVAGRRRHLHRRQRHPGHRLVLPQPARPRDRRPAGDRRPSTRCSSTTSRVGDRARRRRDRLRVRLGLDVLRHRRHDRRGAAPPRPDRGRAQQQAARARIPPSQHQVQGGRPVREGRAHRRRRARHARGRRDARGRAAARRGRPRPGVPGTRLRGAGHPDRARLRRHRRVAAHLGRGRVRGRRPDLGQRRPAPATRARRLRRGHPRRRAHRRAAGRPDRLLRRPAHHLHLPRGRLGRDDRSAGRARSTATKRSRPSPTTCPATGARPS